MPPDTFGNLCLISRSNNSKLNNLIPDAKKGHFSESTAVESLKQVFMLTYSAWGPKNEAASYDRWFRAKVAPAKSSHIPITSSYMKSGPIILRSWVFYTPARNTPKPRLRQQRHLVGV